jgi:hypothetical protein
VVVVTVGTVVETVVDFDLVVVNVSLSYKGIAKQEQAFEILEAGIPREGRAFKTIDAGV